MRLRPPLPGAPPGTPAETPAGTSLVRGLGPWAAAAVTVGTMIGTGIYLKPAEMARLAGSADLMLVAWVVAGGLSLLGALCYAELGTAMPEAGGPYVYLRRAFGPRWGFLYGWSTTFVTNPASAASLAAGTMLFAGFFVPALTTPVAVVPLPWLADGWTITRAQVWGAGLIWLVAVVNFMRVAAVGWVQVALTAIKVGSLALIIGLGVLLGFREMAPAAGTADPVAVQGGVTGFMAAVVAALWAYTGWHTLLHAGSEVADPDRTIPRAVVGGFAGTALLFVLFNVVCVAVLPFDRLAGSDHVASEMLLAVAGPGAAAWLTVAMIISAVGSLNSSTMAGARVPYAMAREGEFFGFLARVDQGTAAPRMAVGFQALLAPILVLTGSFEQLTAFFIFARWLFFALAAWAVIRLRRRDPGAVRPYRVRPFPALPVVFIVAAAALTVSIVLQRPVRSLIGLAIILSGLPAYAWWTRRRTAATS